MKMEVDEDDFEYETPEEDDGGDWRRPTKRRVRAFTSIHKIHFLL